MILDDITSLIWDVKICSLYTGPFQCKPIAVTRERTSVLLVNRLHGDLRETTIPQPVIFTYQELDWDHLKGLVKTGTTTPAPALLSFTPRGWRLKGKLADGIPIRAILSRHGVPRPELFNPLW